MSPAERGGRAGGGCRRQGWMSGLRCARARVRARVCSRVDLLVGSSPTLQATHCDRTTRALHSESGFTSHAVNGLKAAGPGTACTLLVCRRPPFQFIILHSFSHDEHKQPWAQKGKTWNKYHHLFTCLRSYKNCTSNESNCKRRHNYLHYVHRLDTRGGPSQHHITNSGNYKAWICFCSRGHLVFFWNQQWHERLESMEESKFHDYGPHATMVAVL